MSSANAARKYFRRLAATARSRAAIARAEAAREPDPTIRRNLEALAQSQDEQAAAYDHRHDEVTG